MWHRTSVVIYIYIWEAQPSVTDSWRVRTMAEGLVEPMLVYVYVAPYKRPQTQPNLSIKADTVLPGWAKLVWMWPSA